MSSPPFKASNIVPKKGAEPFAKNEKDDGWGKGKAWEQFTDDTEEKILDKHHQPIPYYMSGTEKKHYAYRVERDMVVKAKKKGGPVLKEEEWSYVLRNYSADLPTAPIETTDDWGFYDYSPNIKDIPADWDKK
jgi:hypothetical protein